MQIVDNIKTFLYDRDYFINVFDNKIHVFNYLDLIELKDSEIILKMEHFNLYLIGSDLHVTKMAEKEIMITGVIDYMRFKR